MNLIRSMLLLLICVAVLRAGEAPLSISDLRASIAGDVLHANEMTIGPLILQDVVCKPELKNQTLILHDCHATVFGGTATGMVTIDFTKNTMQITCNVKQVDLSVLLAAFGANADAFAGVVGGEVDLTFPMNDFRSASGRGRVTIENGNLVELSFLTNLLIGDISNTRNQDSAEATFAMRGDGLITLTSARAVLPKGILLISGTVNFDGSLRLLVIPRLSGGLLSQVWFIGKWFGSALAFASSHVARAVIHGTVNKPVIVINPFASK